MEPYRGWAVFLDKERPLLDKLHWHLKKKKTVWEVLKYVRLIGGDNSSLWRFRTKDSEKEKEEKQDMAMNSTSEAENKEESLLSPQSVP